MNIRLNKIGWVNEETGKLQGKWTDYADKVNLNDKIIVPSGVVVNTSGGDDAIIGNGELVGIENLSMLETGEGNDAITGSGGVVGIDNFGIIELLSHL